MFSSMTRIQDIQDILNTFANKTKFTGASDLRIERPLQIDLTELEDDPFFPGFSSHFFFFFKCMPDLNLVLSIKKKKNNNGKREGGGSYGKGFQK